ncbi:MAG: hypothetical protein NZ533_05300 [Casimicrobiaceae bacterium]|nr:hypothetical protein [Casimicrobiaceae bacterium]MCX8098827.1 hypothetical protein [Casimicrobiaceae bacterium]MDW8311520.1 hypothetical protein [Burkholderiales bacterium]
MSRGPIPCYAAARITSARQKLNRVPLWPPAPTRKPRAANQRIVGIECAKGEAQRIGQLALPPFEPTTRVLFKRRIAMRPRPRRGERKMSAR